MTSKAPGWGSGARTQTASARPKREGPRGERECVSSLGGSSSRSRLEKGLGRTSSTPLSRLTSISMPSRPVSAGKLTAGPIDEPSTELRNWTTTVAALGTTGLGTSSDGPESLTRFGGGSLRKCGEARLV
jgi:hypothetical protein